MASRVKKQVSKKREPITTNVAVLDLTQRALQMMKRVQTANGAQQSQQALVAGGNTYSLPEPLILHATSV
jgi:hypothetical protein